MDVYIAGAYAARDLIRNEVVPLIESAGHRVVSDWLKGTRDITVGSIGTAPDRSDEEVQASALKDLDEVCRADVLVHLTASFMSRWPLEDSLLHTGGRHIETGFALRHSIPVITVGQPENIFLRSLTTVVEDIAGVNVTLENFHLFSLTS